MTDNKDQIIDLFRDDNSETESMRNFIFGSLISCESNETEEDCLGNIEALEKIRNALVGVPEAAKSYERTLELIDILKEEKVAVQTNGIYAPFDTLGVGKMPQ